MIIIVLCYVYFYYYFYFYFWVHFVRLDPMPNHHHPTLGPSAQLRLSLLTGLFAPSQQACSARPHGLPPRTPGCLTSPRQDLPLTSSCLEPSLATSPLTHHPYPLHSSHPISLTLTHQPPSSHTLPIPSPTTFVNRTHTRPTPTKTLPQT